MLKKLLCMHNIATLMTLMSAPDSTNAPHKFVFLSFSILPRSFLANWPQKGADGEDNGLQDHVEQTAKPPEKIGNFLLDESGDPNKLLTPVALDSPRAFSIFPMTNNCAKTICDFFSVTRFFPIL